MLRPNLVVSAASGPIMPSSFSQSSREQEPLPKSPSLLFSLSPAHPPWRMSLACISLVRDGTSASKNPNLLHGLRTARLHSPFAAMSMETGTSLPRPGMGASSSAQQQGDQEESRVSQQGEKMFPNPLAMCRHLFPSWDHLMQRPFIRTLSWHAPGARKRQGILEACFNRHVLISDRSRKSASF